MPVVQRAHGGDIPDHVPAPVLFSSPRSKGLSRSDDAHLVDGRQGTGWSGRVSRAGREGKLANVMGIRELAKQGLNGLALSRMDPVRSEFNHGR